MLFVGIYQFQASIFTHLMIMSDKLREELTLYVIVI